MNCLKLKISVRMGSNQIKIRIDNKLNITSNDLIKCVLKKCDLIKSVNFATTYSLYENVFGVERQVCKSEKILNLVQSWPENSKGHFVIRKVKKSMQPIKRLDTKKYFKKLRTMRSQCQQNNSLHIYEEIHFEATNQFKQDSEQKKTTSSRMLKNLLFSFKKKYSF